MDLADAKKTYGSRPVKIQVQRYTNADSLGRDWVDLQPGQFVQGCLVADGVYAVTVAGVRVICG